MSEAGREAAKLWRVRKTVYEMVRDRGYEVTDDEVNMSLEDFKSLYCGDGEGRPNRKQLAFKALPSAAMIEKMTDPANPASVPGPLWVEFCDEMNVGIKHLRQFAQTIWNDKFDVGIFITMVPLTASALKVIPTVLPSIIETFLESDLLVNITRHELVPKHILLSKTEKRALLDRYRLKETQLPRIQSADPVARYLGLRKGMVVKIIRKSETAGRYASYRWVV